MSLSYGASRPDDAARERKGISVFISYRRSDSQGSAGRLYDKLVLRFGKSSVFMDVDAIPLGLDFVHHLDAAVARCDVLIVVIGQDWLTAADDDGNRRIDDPNDFVRLEVAAALRRDIRVIPVLVDGAVLPKAAKLPDDVKGLARRNGMALRHERYESDVTRLIDELMRLGTAPPTPHPEATEAAEAVPAGEPSAVVVGTLESPAAGAAAQGLGSLVPLSRTEPASMPPAGHPGQSSMPTPGAIVAEPSTASAPVHSPVSVDPSVATKGAVADDRPSSESPRARRGLVEWWLGVVALSVAAVAGAWLAAPWLASPSSKVSPPTGEASQPPKGEESLTPKGEESLTPKGEESLTPKGEEPSTPALGPARPESGAMVRIPAGSFMMGSDDGDADEKPVHEVKLESFEMDVTEVTVKAYKACVDAGACSAPGTEEESCNWRKDSRGEHPVNCVDWDQATAFCSWANKRLPTEEEWEYAARGTENRTYPWGNEAPDAERLCWMRTPSNGTCSVGSLSTGDTPLGLHDMGGNVWEWTSSNYCQYDKTGCSEAARVFRGGSWFVVNPSLVRAALRLRYAPSERSDCLGFRCAR